MQVEKYLSARISDPEFWTQVNQAFGVAGGIYRVSCEGEPGTRLPMPIRRLLSTDPAGTLYIGMAASFVNRVIELKKSLSPDHRSAAHECGSRYKSHVAIAERFPYQRLLITLEHSNAPREAELMALKSYYDTFGELPPFNRSG